MAQARLERQRPKTKGPQPTTNHPSGSHRAVWCCCSNTHTQSYVPGYLGYTRIVARIRAGGDGASEDGACVEWIDRQTKGNDQYHHHYHYHPWMSRLTDSGPDLLFCLSCPVADPVQRKRTGGGGGEGRRYKITYDPASSRFLG